MALFILSLFSELYVWWWNLPGYTETMRFIFCFGFRAWHFLKNKGADTDQIPHMYNISLIWLSALGVCWVTLHVIGRRARRYLAVQRIVPLFLSLPVRWKLHSNKILWLFFAFIKKRKKNEKPRVTVTERKTNWFLPRRRGLIQIVHKTSLVLWKTHNLASLH